MADLKQVLEKDGKVDWELFISRHSEYSPQFAFLAISVPYPRDFLRRAIGVDFEFRNLKRVGDDYFWSIKEYSELRRVLDSEGNKDASYFTYIIRKVEKHCKNLVEFCHDIRNRKDLKSKSNQELLIILEKYWSMLGNAAAFLLVKHNLNRVLEKHVMRRLEEILKPKGKNAQANLYFEKMLIPAKETLIKKANRSLEELALKGEPDEHDITHWLAEYSWIETFTWLGKPLTEPDVKKMVDKIRFEKQTKVDKDNEESGQFERIRQELKLEGDVLIEIMALQDLLYLHTYELECLFAAKYWCENLLTETASRIGLNFEECAYAIYPEIVAALKGKKLDRKKVLLRKGNQYALFQFDGKLTIFEGDYFKKILASQKQLEKEAGEIKGNTAFGGSVRGKVKIIRTVNDFTKFEDGDILITTMTTTDFTPHLYKAKAIVTDEGGITCHAAIVSRELGIPCIIGTKAATRVLKDGDMVEVNADKGIVKILKGL